MLNVRSKRLARIRPKTDAQAVHLAGEYLAHAWSRYQKYRDGLDKFEARKLFVRNPLWTPSANRLAIRLQVLGVRYYEYMLLDVVDDLSAIKAYGLNVQAMFPSFGELVRELSSATAYCSRRLDELDYCLALAGT